MSEKILIVEPRNAIANVFSMFDFLPLLGTIYLGTILKENGFHVEVLNENIIGRDVTISDLDTDILLISALTPSVERAYEIARTFKAVRPNARVIIGGPHVTFMPEEALQYADQVARFECENIILPLVRNEIKERVVTGTPYNELDIIPIPDFSIMRNFENMKIYPLITSRGCPFDCSFCCVTSMFGRHYRTLSIDRVISEIMRVPDNMSIFFYDDNFAANIRRTEELMDRIIGLKRLGKRISFTAQVHTSLARYPETIKKMATAGCSRVYVGFESINPCTLKEFRKKQTPFEIERAVSIFQDAGIRVHGMFVLGSDQDDSIVVKDTADFARRNHIDTVQFLALTPLPGTEVFNKLESDDRILHRLWRYYDALHVVFKPKNFTPIALQENVIGAFQNFYSVINTCNAAMNEVSKNLVGLVENTYRKYNATVYNNTILRLGGLFVVKKWLTTNVDYMEYLRKYIPIK